VGKKKKRNKKAQQGTTHQFATEWLVQWRPTRDGQLGRMVLDEETGRVTMLGTDGVEIPVEQRHAETISERRTGKWKVLSRFASSLPFTKRLSLKPDIAAYDWIAAVDATPREGRSIIPVLTNLAPPVGEVIKLQCRVFDVVGVRCEPEKLGWLLACSEILCGREHYKSGQRVALISDADLGIHKQVNNREIEFLPGFSLPEGFDLGYGKEDTAADTLLQSLVRLADRIGKQFLAEYPLSSPSQVFEDAPAQYSAFYDRSAAFMPPTSWFKRLPG
jgi:hypothetical protein